MAGVHAIPLALAARGALRSGSAAFGRADLSLDQHGFVIDTSLFLLINELLS